MKTEAYEKLGVDEYWIVMLKSRSVEVYYLENGKYILNAAFILENEEESLDYNADAVLTLRVMKNISMIYG